MCLIVVGALPPLCFLFSVFQNARPPATPRRLGPPLTQRSKTLGPGRAAPRVAGVNLFDRRNSLKRNLITARHVTMNTQRSKHNTGTQPQEAREVRASVIAAPTGASDKPDWRRAKDVNDVEHRKHG